MRFANQSETHQSQRGLFGFLKMSKAHLDDLRDALQTEGWVLLDPQSMYWLDREVISWSLKHSISKKVVTVDFYAFEDLGRRTESLEDILYCMLRDSRIKLYFEKRNSKEWKQSIAGFVEAMRSQLHECSSG